MIGDFNQTICYLESLIPLKTPQKFPGKLGLERMRYLLSLLGNPQKKFFTIHVTGTAGKGSTCFLLSKILTLSNFKTGSIFSPHIVDIRERMQINTNLIQKSEFTSLINQIKPFVDEVKKTKYGQPTYFEVLIAAAFLLFAQKKIDLAVVEVGMGGRFDGTNILESGIKIITNIGLDHTKVLGKTVEKICDDKSEIIKKNSIVITGVNQKRALGIIKQKCKRRDVECKILNTDFNYHLKGMDEKGEIFDLVTSQNTYKNLQISLLGEYQLKNASLAIVALENLAKFGFSINEDKIRIGLKQAFFPGRMEVVQKPPLIVLDGAHNPMKMKSSISSFRRIFSYRKLFVILAIKKDKDIKEMIKYLVKYADEFIITRFYLSCDIGFSLAAQPAVIKKAILDQKFLGKITTFKNVQKALEYTKKKIKTGEAILLTGSLYLVSEARHYLVPRQAHKVVQ